jgi:hypothetical protein
MEKLIATIYCLDKEDTITYGELMKDKLGKDIVIPKRLASLKLRKNKLIQEDYMHKDYIAGIDPYLDDNSVHFYQREGDMDNLPESTITYSNTSPEELTEIFMKQPIQLQQYVTIEEAIKKLTEELSQDEEHYIAWKAAIAMSFKDEVYRLRPVTNRWNSDIVHKIANKAADNFLKQLIG